MERASAKARHSVCATCGGCDWASDRANALVSIAANWGVLSECEVSARAVVTETLVVASSGPLGSGGAARRFNFETGNGNEKRKGEM